MSGELRDVRKRGFTLVEILAVVTALALIGAAVSLERGDTTADPALDAAAHAVAGALRHARSEALRSGAERGVRVVAASGQVTVYEPDLSGGSIVIANVLPDPLSKHPYSFQVQDLASAGRVRIDASSLPFDYDSGGASSIDVLFDASGVAVLVNAGSRLLLDQGRVELEIGDFSRRVELSRIGRVTIQ